MIFSCIAKSRSWGGIIIPCAELSTRVASWAKLTSGDSLGIETQGDSVA